MRLLESTVLVTMTHTSDHATTMTLAIECTKYHKLTFGRSGHTSDLPGPLLITRYAIFAHSVAAAEYGHFEHPRLRQIVPPPPPFRLESDAFMIENITKYETKTPAEVTARMNRLEATNVRVRIAQEIYVFRMRACRNGALYSNFQFCARSTLPIVTNFFSSLLAILTTQAQGELRYGMAFPSSCERALKKLLADMRDSDDNF